MGRRTVLVLSTQPGERPGIIGWFRRHHPEVNKATLAAHIQAATINAANRAQNNRWERAPRCCAALTTACMSGPPSYKSRQRTARSPSAPRS